MVERFFCYSDLFSLSANQTAYDQRLLIRQNADFYLRAMGMYNSSGAVGGRFRRADASWFTGPNFFHLNTFLNTGGFARPTPIYPELRYPASSAFVFDLTDLGGAGDSTIYPMLMGVERYQDGVLPPPALPAQYLEQPYSISVPITLSTAAPQSLGNLIKCQTGEPFIIRTLSWRYDTTQTQPFTLQVRWFDEYSRAFMQTWVPMRLLFSGPTDANAPYPGFVFPEMVIPANGSYVLDAQTSEVGTFVVELVFSGVRLTQVGS